MSFLIPLARAAASVAGKGRLSAFMMGKSAGSNETESQPKEAPETPTMSDITSGVH